MCSKDSCWSYPCSVVERFDIEKPRWDQETFIGRAIYYFLVTNPMNIFVSEKELDRCACLVKKIRAKEALPDCITEDEIWAAKELYDSAYHPDSGQKMNILGRMSAQVPMNTLITGGMMAFYKGIAANIFWQWFNQSFNALVNFTNRSGSNPISNRQLTISYLCATGSALSTALYLQHLAKRASPIMGRFVPFAAVAAANMINIPFMRAQELKDGLVVVDCKDRPLGYSKKAAQQAISAVTISRILMSLPGMVLTPFVMDYLEKRGTLCRYPWINLPTQCALVAVCLTFATPLCCALFKQRSEMKVKDLEKELKDKIRHLRKPPKIVYYNKGL